MIDRIKAAKFGVSVKDIDAALNDAFSQRAVSTIYSYRNQYNVILKPPSTPSAQPRRFRQHLWKGSQGQQVPLKAVARIEVTSMPLVVSHTGQFPGGHDQLQ